MLEEIRSAEDIVSDNKQTFKGIKRKFDLEKEESEKEKETQVRSMTKIYENALQVVVCLGDAPNARLALNLMISTTILPKTMSPNAFSNHVWGFYAARKQDKVLAADLSALIDLMNHDWFSRAWIVQEVVVARYITVVYGGYKLRWEDLLAFLNILSEEKNASLISLFRNTGREFVNQPMSFGPSHAVSITHYRGQFLSKEPIPLFKALRTYHGLLATKPRDKIFALLGFTTLRHELDHLVHYTDKSNSNLLLKIAYHMIKHGNFFEVLQLAGIGWDQPAETDPSYVADLPSWVVNVSFY